MPAFSVLIPTYNHALFLTDAIESVLEQTCQDFEIIVVDDASTDNTNEVMKQYQDPRVRYLVHDQNEGLSASRNTGIQAATGEYIAFLDADDMFAKQKLELHLSYLQHHPDIGVTYNARFELNHSATTIREIWRPPVEVGLQDFVLGFPFAPSDMVMRKDWPGRVGLLNERYTLYSEDLYFYCQLALSGCRFASVDRALNYRRRHSHRIIRGIAEYIRQYVEILNGVFEDARCPANVVTLKDFACGIEYLLWGLTALAQDDTAIGQFCLQKAFQLYPRWLAEEREQVAAACIESSVADDSVDHCDFLKKLIDQLPGEAGWLADHYAEMATRGYLVKGLRSIIWGRAEDGQRYVDQAANRRAKLDRPFLESVATHLLDYEIEFGDQSAEAIIRRLSPAVARLGGQASLKWLIGYYSINRAFNSYRSQAYRDVPAQMLRAMLNHPNYLQNRGAIKVLLSSVIRSARRTQLSPPSSLVVGPALRG